jgi:hypothetical protein
MGQTARQQLLDDIAHAARGVEMVHVARAVGIDARDQRHGMRQLVHILPVEDDPAARAMAGIWMAWLVDPPVASRPTTAFTMAFSFTISPIGR